MLNYIFNYIYIIHKKSNYLTYDRLREKEHRIGFEIVVVALRVK